MTRENELLARCAGSGVAQRKTNLAEFQSLPELPVGLYEISWDWDATKEEAERGWGRSSSGSVVNVVVGGWTMRDAVYFALGHTVGSFRDNRLTVEHPYNMDNMVKYTPLVRNFAPPGIQRNKVEVVFIGQDYRSAQLQKALTQTVRPGQYTIRGTYGALFHPEGAHDARFGMGNYRELHDPRGTDPQLYDREIAVRICVEVQGMTLRDLCFLAAGMSDFSGLGEAMPIGPIAVSEVEYVPISFSQDKLCRSESVSRPATKPARELPDSTRRLQLPW